MELETAANVLSKIGNPTRLRIVRLLVRAGDDGLPVGTIQQQRRQATLICKMQYDLLRDLVDYLTEECCADENTRDNAA